LRLAAAATLGLMTARMMPASFSSGSGTAPAGYSLCILSSSDSLYFEGIDEADLVSTGGELRVQEPRVLDPLPLAADRSVEHGKMQTHGVPYLSLLSCRPPLFGLIPRLGERERLAYRRFCSVTVASGGRLAGVTFAGFAISSRHG
jgi:hypothetical protein